MKTETYIAIYSVLVQSAFWLSLATWVGYTTLAPWTKYSMGKLMWLMLFTITLVLSVPVMYVLIGGFPLRYELSIIFMGLFNVTMVILAYGVYTKQIKGYLKSKAHLRKVRAVKREESR